VNCAVFGWPGGVLASFWPRSAWFRWPAGISGATTPIISFGNSLVKGAMQEFAQNGWLGLLTGIFEVTGAGVSAAIIFSFLAALFFRAKS